MRGEKQKLDSRFDLSERLDKLEKVILTVSSGIQALETIGGWTDGQKGELSSLLSSALTVYSETLWSLGERSDDMGLLPDDE